MSDEDFIEEPEKKFVIATWAVWLSLPGSSWEAQGGIDHISLAEPKDESNYFEAFLPYKSQGEDCKWSVRDSKHTFNEVSDSFDVYSDCKEVARWITEQYEAWQKR